jgi:hypothetical protein
MDPTEKGYDTMSSRRPVPLSYVECCLLAIILFGCCVLFNRGEDHSGTLAPPTALLIR